MHNNAGRKRSCQKALMIAAALACVLARGGTSECAQDPTPLVIARVTVIDGTGGAPQPDRTVVVHRDRIAGIHDGAQFQPQADARVVDGQGLFLIPGLWDMHAHGATERDYLELFVAHGVTGVRSMFESLDRIKSRRQAIAEGREVGPRIVAAGRVLDGPFPVLPGATRINNAEEARKAVAAIEEEGSDFIKVYSFLPRDAFFAIAEEAKRRKLPFAGHVPESVTAAEASNAGQKSIEHLTGVLYACSSEQPAITEAIQNSLGSGGGWSTYMTFIQLQAQCATSFNQAKAGKLFELFVRNRTWHCPTLTVHRGFASLGSRGVSVDPRARLLSPWLRRLWEPMNGVFAHYITAEGFDSLNAVFRKNLEIVGMMKRAGVEILAGTDTLGPSSFPGSSLHDELSLLVEAGLTPREALQTATLNAARYLGREADLGTIERGKLADMVLLAGDPLENIRNTRLISAVILGGKLLESPELEGMIQSVYERRSF